MSLSTGAAQAHSADLDWHSFFGADAHQAGADVVALIDQDRKREALSLNMIASASYAPLGLRQIEGTHLVNRAPMGLPGRRSVANCEELDAIENLAIDRAKVIFGAEYVNVQALSSTIANVAVLRAILPADGARLLTFDELAGGHVSHGAMRHITGANREVVSFGVTSTGAVDLDQARELARKMRPHVLLAGPSSYPREIDFAGLKTIADEVDALLFTDIAHVAGLIAAGLHANPVPFSDVSTSSTQKTLCGPRNGAFVFAKERFGAAIDAAVYPGLQGPAASNMIAARAVQMDMITRPAFAQLMRDVVANAKAFAAGLEEGGIGLYTGGTDSHMIMAYTGESWTQPELVAGLGAYGVIGNAMRAPGQAGEPRTAFRFGSVALTIRGFDIAEARTLGREVAEILRAGPSAAVDAARLRRLKDLANAHPIPSFVD
ncbi:serine hydroxymethyltransferase [Bradyrhizobium sp.]|jgi:glycine hydroxymethyltransferase|uniref:serine hydroxymethyltransferase n=1 Tax=Bradyrhizobium sp. TaxID=376 RepID=UPI002DDCE90F|nr:serine hydroxymethyltransferase [Bradyrhizobium sp.]HEV2155547.1 serine hydroxymethyltransferase [Bradyrhizobium sp.]